MATPDSTVWKIDPHTTAKHRLLRGYLDAWMPIVTSSFPRVTIFEGYAGPGVYEDGEPGSPIIAMRALLSRSELVKARKPVQFVFVEERDDRIAELERQVDRFFSGRPPWVRVEFVRGACADTWRSSLDRTGAWGQPIFANLDPFGAGIPYDLVEALGGNKSSEALVTFMQQFLARFAKVESLTDGDVQFGNTDWRRVRDIATGGKEGFLVEEYRGTLARAGLPLTSAFQLVDEGGHSFWLIHGTSHELGLTRMKEAMWKVDEVSGYRFRDPRDPGQGLLDFGDPEPDLAPLRRQMLRLLEDGKSRSKKELRHFALHETIYRPPHATAALAELIERGDIIEVPGGVVLAPLTLDI